MPAFSEQDRLFQRLLIELQETDLLDVAGLLVAQQQVSSAADIGEIVGRQLEAGAKRVERLKHLQPTLSLRP